MNRDNEDFVFSVVQGVLAVLVVGSACVIAVVSVARGGQVPDVPAWLTLAIGAILGFFFGARTVKSGAAIAVNGMLSAAAKIAASSANTAGSDQERALLLGARAQAAKTAPAGDAASTPGASGG